MDEKKIHEKKPGVPILISVKIDLKEKKGITKDNNGQFK